MVVPLVIAAAGLLTVAYLYKILGESEPTPQSETLTNYLELRLQEEYKAKLAACRREAERDRAAAASLAKKNSALLRQAEADRLASQMREQAALKAAKDARMDHRRGIQPVELPTREEYDVAMRQIENKPWKVHFAVCGNSGAGKSSLVNAFRGLTNNHVRAAKVGEVETTLGIGRFQDPRPGLPYSHFVWYDIPGAGTLQVSECQYFNKQGLFVFDCIIVAYDARFTKADKEIIENCNRWQIPVFIVRSKADQHISNSIADATRDENNEYGLERHDPGYEKKYQEMQEKFITDTRTNFCEQTQLMKDESKKRELEVGQSNSGLAIGTKFEPAYRQWLSNMRIYIVSAKNVRALSNMTEKKAVDDSTHIDETDLFKDLLEQVALRRYHRSEVPDSPYTPHTSVDYHTSHSSVSMQPSAGLRRWLGRLCH